MYIFFVLANCPSGCVNGRCVSPGTCDCDAGWRGQSCESGRLLSLDRTKYYNKDSIL